MIYDIETIIAANGNSFRQTHISKRKQNHNINENLIFC